MKYIIEFEDKPFMHEDGMKFYKCIQAPWWGLSERVIKQLTPYQPDIAPGTNVGDTISRQVAIDALDEQIEQCNRALGAFYISLKDEYAIKVERASLKAYKEQLENLPSAQPERVCVATVTLTDEQVKEVAEKAKNAVISVIESEPHWIPCSERLPNHDEYIKNNGLFIVSDGNRSYSEWYDIYDKRKFGEPTMSGFRIDYAVTAWMPLPDPYKGGDSE